MSSDPLLINDLRLRVLNGEEIEPEEMLLIVDQIRAGRRSAADRARVAKEAKPAKRAAPRKLAAEELGSLLDNI